MSRRSSLLRCFASRLSFAVCAFLMITGVSAGEPVNPSEESAIPAEDLEFFEAKVRPLLVERCYACHSDEKQKGGLRLDSRAGWQRGGDNGAALLPGQADQSLIITAVSYQNVDLQMPPKRKLSDAEIETLRQWITMGAPDPRADESASAASDFDFDARLANHWSWQEIRDPSPPSVSSKDWPRRPLDRFVLARLESAKLSPAPETDRRSWIRRVSFDLTGLPPTIADVEAFLADESESAYERVVDRLLESEAYGEKWATHWLDLMRFAETKGHEADYPIPEAWRYRDYVIRLFNDDVPYDRMVVEHVAGDLVPDPRIDAERKTNESVQGTGMWHLGDASHSPVDIRGEESDRISNSIDTFSRAFLGLSLACARCHDHKFDAMSQKDFYAIYGFLQSSSFHLADVADPKAQDDALNALAGVRANEGTQLIAAKAAEYQSAIQSSQDYLLEATRRLLGKRAPKSKAKRAKSNLDEKRVLAWVEALKRAEGDPIDPLHPVARVARVKKGRAVAAECQKLAKELEQRESSERQAYLSRQLTRTVEQGERNYVQSQVPFSPEYVIADYTRPGASELDWIPSGKRFGEAPLRAGSVVFSKDPAKPIARIVERGEAAGDFPTSRFSGFLRTKTFEVASDTLWYRYRGKGQAFLAVDSHRTVHGPLHGVVRQKLAGKGSEWTWHAHKVRDYIGHRVHVEFTAGSEDFAVERVEFSDKPPTEPFRQNAVLRRALEKARDIRTLVREISSALRVSVDLFSVDGLVDCDYPRDRTALVSWVRRNPSLFGEVDAQLQAKTAQLAKQVIEKRQAIEAKIPARIPALALLDGSPENEPLHIRGNHKTLSEELVPRRNLTAFVGADAKVATKTGSGRLEFARQLVQPSNTLVRRVMVNRLWHYLFGRGIVQTVDDFGSMGREPTHPDLLDYLASDLVRKNWSLKRMIKELVLSSTYRMSSKRRPDAEEVDPTNKLFHRMPTKRLTAEVIRDSLLAVSGRLDRTIHGPGVMVHITPFMRGNRSPRGSGPMDSGGRRSLYIQVHRNHLSHFLTAFDRPLPFTAVGKRHVSNSPAQPLIMLNDPLVHEQAKIWAKKLSESPGTAEDKVRRAYLMAFARPPSGAESKRATQYIRDISGDGQDAAKSLEAWRDLCHTLFNLKEFIFLK